MSKFILQFKAFLKTWLVSKISFSVNVSNFPFETFHISSVISSVSFSTTFQKEKTSNFPFFITTVS